MTVGQFLEATGITLVELARLASVNYGTLHKHVRHNHPLGLKVARALARVEIGEHKIDAALVLGLDQPTPPRTRRVSRARKVA
jgi:hypothetical protein